MSRQNNYFNKGTGGSNPNHNWPGLYGYQGQGGYNQGQYGAGGRGGGYSR